MRLVGMNGTKVIPHHLRTLGERLRYRRRQMGWTQEQLAVQAGTNQAVIQKIETGKSLRPRKIDEIASVLDVNPAWLMFGDEKAQIKATPITQRPNRFLHFYGNTVRFFHYVEMAERNGGQW